METIECNKCGEVDNYRTEPSGQHIKAICNKCDSYIKFLPQHDKEFIMPFGKYKDEPLSKLTHPDEIRYLNWMLSGNFNNSIKNKIILHLNSIKNG